MDQKCCWREYKEIIYTDDGEYRLCGLHAKILKKELEDQGKDYY